MNNYLINSKYSEKTNEQIIDIIKAKIRTSNSIESITGIIYKITFVNAQYIKYTGENRNNGNPEDILFGDIKSVLSILKVLKVFNTSNEKLKKEIPRKIYKKRSPLFAILLATGIVIKG